MVATKYNDSGDLLTFLTTKNTLTTHNKLGHLRNFLPHWRPTRQFLFRFQVQIDPDGYISTVPGTTKTSVKGISAAGDGTEAVCGCDRRGRVLGGN